MQGHSTRAECTTGRTHPYHTGPQIMTAASCSARERVLPSALILLPWDAMYAGACRHERPVRRNTFAIRTSLAHRERVTTVLMKRSFIPGASRGRTSHASATTRFPPYSRILLALPFLTLLLLALAPTLYGHLRAASILSIIADRPQSALSAL